MNLEFLTPPGWLLALLVLLPAAAFLGVSRRADWMRSSLGLPGLSLGRRLVPLVAVVLVAGLVGAAAAQPVVDRTTTRKVRSDAEVVMVFDISRSMLAQRNARSLTRLERAKKAAVRLRSSLPAVRVGIASLTNRVLPHLFPTPDEDVFRATLEKTVAVDHPRPASGFILAPEQQALRNATFLSALASVASKHFYSPASKRRLLVVLTDGESVKVSKADVGRRLLAGGIDTIFVHVWDSGERVFTDGEPEGNYRPIPASRSILDGLASATRGRVFDEASLEAAVRRSRDVIGTGPTVTEGHRPDRIPLAPYLAAFAFLPLGLLLWQRDR
jgi:von Willebrand factor type A domain